VLESTAGLDPARYRVNETKLLTPVLVIYPAVVRHNIDRMIAVMGGEPGRWRPHLKTAKLGYVMKMLVEAGVTTAKCATTLELLTACEAGFQDVLVAYPHMGRNAERVAAIAAAYPHVKVSAIVEAKEQIRDWMNTPVDLFIDINTGMNRTGIERDQAEILTELASAIQAAGLRFRGLHFYDGNSAEPDLAERSKRAHARYDDLLQLIAAAETESVHIKEVITAGTPAVPCALSYPGLWNASFTHQLSPGTVIYNDASSLAQLPESYDLKPAALVISQVVSHPKPDVVTCDAGHKSVSVDSGVPNCLVLGKGELRALKPSEEHLPFAISDSARQPPLGELLYLLPRHICPTVNNYDWAAIVERGAVTSVERVSARGHEGPV